MKKQSLMQWLSKFTTSNGVISDHSKIVAELNINKPIKRVNIESETIDYSKFNRVNHDFNKIIVDDEFGITYNGKIPFIDNLNNNGIR